MPNKITTVEEFCTEIGVTVFILKYYCKTFNIEIFSKDYLVDKKSLWLNPSDVVTTKFIKEFSEKQLHLVEYERDFFSIRRVEEIADKLKVDIHSVLTYLNKSKAYISGHKLSIGEDFSPSTKLNKISSYQILNGIQLEERKSLINNYTRNPTELK